MDLRAARPVKSEREQLIVDFLNRGVSLAEIAARVGLSEKRMRAISCDPPDWDPGGRPMPHPAKPLAAIEVSRLNEAPLVAFAMTGANLEAVDRVATIIRELDRYHGAFVAAKRRRSEPACSGAPAGGATAYGGTLFCSVKLAARDGGEIGWTAAPRPHPEEPAKRASQRTLQEASSFPLERPSRRAACGAAPQDEAAGANGGHAERDGRPENPAQTLEKVDSAPGIAPDPQFSTVATRWNLLRGATLCVAPQHEVGDCPSAAAAADNRPEILLQAIEKVDSAPGVSTLPETIGGADAARPGTRAAALDKVGRDAPAADNHPETRKWRRISLKHSKPTRKWQARRRA